MKTKEKIREIKCKFRLIGARARIIPFTPESSFFRLGLFSISIIEDAKGKLFDISISMELLQNLTVSKFNLDDNSLVFESIDLKLRFLLSAKEDDYFIQDISSLTGSLTSKVYGSKDKTANDKRRNFGFKTGEWSFRSKPLIHRPFDQRNFYSGKGNESMVGKFEMNKHNLETTKQDHRALGA